MRKFSSGRKADSGLYMRRDDSIAAWRSQNGSCGLPGRGVRSHADSTFNPRSSVAPGLRTAGEAHRHRDCHRLPFFATRTEVPDASKTELGVGLARGASVKTWAWHATYTGRRTVDWSTMCGECLSFACTGRR